MYLPHTRHHSLAPRVLGRVIWTNPRLVPSLDCLHKHPRNHLSTKIPHPPMQTSPPPRGMKAALFLESGVGTDQHGQNLTKACVRAIKDAISFNSIPSLDALVPGGRENIVLRVQLAVPFTVGKNMEPVAPEIDLDVVRAVFPYGTILPIEVIQGGARFESMCSVPSLGDSSDMWVFALACVTVGY